MPEYPDIENYVRLLNATIGGRSVERAFILHPFLLRTAELAAESLAGRTVNSAWSMGKRIVVSLDGGAHMVFHLMIAGRLWWDPKATPGAPIRAARTRSRGRTELMRLRFADGDVVLTEAGTKRRASLHLFEDSHGVESLHPGGRSPLELSSGDFASILRSENHTVKRALTDQHLFLGIGNTYSDEILHAARIPPLRRTESMTDDEIERLSAATRSVLTAWRERIAELWGDGWPKKGETTRTGMAVHGRFGQPCPVCGTPVQRIRYTDRECNYCPVCQNDGKLYADRALSRLLRADWPARVEDLE